MADLTRIGGSGERRERWCHSFAKSIDIEIRPRVALQVVDLAEQGYDADQICRILKKKGKAIVPAIEKLTQAIKERRHIINPANAGQSE